MRLAAAVVVALAGTHAWGRDVGRTAKQTQAAAELEIGRKGAADVTVYLAASEGATTYQAKALATRMFAEIGVQIEWQAGRPTETASPGLTIEVRLAGIALPGYGPEALACAYPYSNETKAITVFHDRVRREAEGWPPLERALLAHVLVHEITHVLERIDRHSDTGVMKAHWTREDYHKMVVNHLPFAPDDVELIRRRRLP